MKKLLQLVLLFFFVTIAGRTQTSNAYATVQWQAPITAWSALNMTNTVHTSTMTHIQGGVLLYWQKSPHCDAYNANILGHPEVKINNADPGITIENVVLLVRGIYCDGRIGNEFYVADKIAPFEHKSQDGNKYHNFKEIKEVISCGFTYKIGDVFYEVHYDKEKGINKFKVNGMSISEYEESEKRKQQEALDRQNNINKDHKFNSGGGVRGEINPSLKPEPLILNNINNNADVQKQTQVQQQKDVYQQRADSYLNSANFSSNDIQKAFNLNQAEINAIAAGNTAQLRQIQNIKQQQSNQLSNDLATAAGNLISGLLDAKIEKKFERLSEDFRDRQNDYELNNHLHETKKLRKAELLTKINADLENLKNAATNNNTKILLLNSINTRYLVLDKISQARYYYSQLKGSVNNSYGLLNGYDIENQSLDSALNDDESMREYRAKGISPSGFGLLGYRFNESYIKKINRKYGFYEITKYLSALFEMNQKAKDYNKINNYLNSIIIDTSKYHDKKPEDYFDDITKPVKVDKYDDLYVGKIGLIVMAAIAMKGEIYYDSAIRINQFYFNLAYQEFNKSLQYYFENLDSFARKNSYKEEYPIIFKSIYHNLLLCAYQLLKNNPNINQINIVNNCMQVFMQYYFPEIAQRKKNEGLANTTY